MSITETATHVIYDKVDETMVLPKRAPFWYPPEYVEPLTRLRNAYNRAAEILGWPDPIPFTMRVSSSLCAAVRYNANGTMRFKGAEVVEDPALEDGSFALAMS